MFGVRQSNITVREKSVRKSGMKKSDEKYVELQAVKNNLKTELKLRNDAHKKLRSEHTKLYE